MMVRWLLLVMILGFLLRSSPRLLAPPPILFPSPRLCLESDCSSVYRSALGGGSVFMFLEFHDDSISRMARMNRSFS